MLPNSNHLENLLTKFGNEISSSDNSAVADTRERRGAVSRLIYQIIMYFAKLVTLI